MKKAKTILALCLTFSFLCLNSCKETLDTAKEKKIIVVKEPTLSLKEQKTKVGNNTYSEAKKRTTKWFKNVEFNTELLIQKKYNVQKHLAEYLGLANILYNSAKTTEEKNDIKNFIFDAYQYTLKPSFHNLHGLDAKTFKANSMSYLRILFLLNNFEFDTQFYREQVAKIKPRLDQHLIQRGDWQKWAFDNYYTALNLEKPVVLNGINAKKGIVSTQIEAEQYTLNQAYELTHLIFAAYNYGAKKTQDKFNLSELNYIKTTLDKLSKKYRLLNNRDILSELVSSMVLLNSNTTEFNTATIYLLQKQNNDGSWGNYEKYRTKHGDLIDIKLYLHTTLVVFESLALQFKKYH